MQKAGWVVGFILGGYFYLLALFEFVNFLTTKHDAVVHGIMSVVLLVCGWLAFPIKPKLPTYDATTYEDPKPGP